MCIKSLNSAIAILMFYCIETGLSENMKSMLYPILLMLFEHLPTEPSKKSVRGLLLLYRKGYIYQQNCLQESLSFPIFLFRLCQNIVR